MGAVMTERTHETLSWVQLGVTTALSSDGRKVVVTLDDKSV
jgi:hypothetical protein